MKHVVSGCLSKMRKSAHTSQIFSTRRCVSLLVIKCATEKNERANKVLCLQVLSGTSVVDNVFGVLSLFSPFVDVPRSNKPCIIVLQISYSEWPPFLHL